MMISGRHGNNYRTGISGNGQLRVMFHGNTIATQTRNRTNKLVNYCLDNLWLTTDAAAAAAQDQELVLPLLQSSPSAVEGLAGDSPPARLNFITLFSYFK